MLLPEVYDIIEVHLKSLQGEILTIIEASLADPDQRKAVKALVNQSVSKKLDVFWQEFGQRDTTRASKFNKKES